MSADLAQRLESVVKRLESVADRLQGSNTSSNTAPAANGTSNTASTASSSKLTAYDAYTQQYVQPFITLCQSDSAYSSVGKYIQIAFDHQRTVIQATTQCKKPSDDELLRYLDPIVQLIQLAQKPIDSKGSHYNQLQAYNESVNMYSWLMSTTPVTTITDALEAADFYLVKTLQQAKAKNDNTAQQYGVQFKQLIQQLIQYVKQNFPAGLEWQNSSGTPLSQFKPNSSSSNTGNSAPPAPAAPPAAPSAPSAPSAPGAPGAPSFTAPSATTAAATTASAGMGAVFSELEASGGKFKFNKVTDDMKTKNQKNVAPLEVKSAPKATPTTASKPAAAPAKPPTTNLVKGTWWVENYTSGTINVPDVQLKENVFISNCSNVTVTINDKTKSITVNSSKRVEVQFKSVVSIFEVVNSANIKIYCLDTVPSVQIDKSNGIQIHLSKAGVEVIPQIITSNVSELNLIVPGPTDDSDPIELPLPEQYISKYVDGKIVTEAVSHSGTG